MVQPSALRDLKGLWSSGRALGFRVIVVEVRASNEFFCFFMSASYMFLRLSMRFA